MPESNEIENDKLKNRSEFSETVHAVIPRVRSDKRNTGWHLPTKKPGAAMNPYLFGRSPFRKASARKHAPQTLARTSVLNSRCSPRIRLLKYPNRPSAPTLRHNISFGNRPEPCRKPRSPAPARKPGARPGPRFALRVRIRGGWHRRHRASPTRRIRSRAPPRGRSPKPSPSA